MTRYGHVESLVRICWEWQEGAGSRSQSGWIAPMRSHKCRKACAEHFDSFGQLTDRTCQQASSEAQTVGPGLTSLCATADRPTVDAVVADGGRSSVTV